MHYISESCICLFVLLQLVTIIMCCPLGRVSLEKGVNFVLRLWKSKNESLPFQVELISRLCQSVVKVSVTQKVVMVTVSRKMNEDSRPTSFSLAFECTYIAIIIRPLIMNVLLVCISDSVYVFALFFRCLFL